MVIHFDCTNLNKNCSKSYLGSVCAGPGIKDSQLLVLTGCCQHCSITSPRNALNHITMAIQHCRQITTVFTINKTSYRTGATIKHHLQILTKYRHYQNGP